MPDGLMWYVCVWEEGLKRLLGVFYPSFEVQTACLEEVLCTLSKHRAGQGRFLNVMTQNLSSLSVGQ